MSAQKDFPSCNIPSTLYTICESDFSTIFLAYFMVCKYSAKFAPRHLKNSIEKNIELSKG